MAVEWHSPNYTPGNSDFDLPSEYNQRGGYYGVGGIPHTQWNGVQNTVGGYPNANWQPMYNSFLPIYNSMVGDETPYEISINGMVTDGTVSYDVTLSLDADHTSSNDVVHVFVVEDEIYSYWSTVSQWHNARNVVRIWEDPSEVSISSAGEIESVGASTFSLVDTWVQEKVKIIAIVQNNSTKQILQVSQVYIDGMNPDVDDDGVMNWDDNCPQDYNPSQNDVDNDLIGDECDPCNNLIYVLGNLNGDTDSNGNPSINVFDVLALVDYILAEESEGCHVDVANINGDGIINVIDIVALVQGIMNNSWGRSSTQDGMTIGAIEIQESDLGQVINLSSDQPLISGFQFTIPQLEMNELPLVEMELPIGWNFHQSVKNDKYFYIAFDETGENPSSNIQINIPSHSVVEEIVVSNSMGEEMEMIPVFKKESIPISLPNKPDIWSLSPNPFNPVLTISFSIPFDTKGKVSVFNTLGEEIDILADRSIMQAGNHTFQWDASDHASGMYFIRIATPNGYDTKKALLLK